LIAVDTNILVYAHRGESPFHLPAARRLKEIAQGNAAWAIPWPCIHEFIATVTNRRAYQPPTTIEVALRYVDALLDSPSLVLLSETDTHWQRLRALVVGGQITGGRIHDARIAAICLEHNVRVLWSADRDFGRFSQLKVVNPLTQ
jgi:toxin-antitoxin system PIN domain toxin